MTEEPRRGANLTAWGLALGGLRLRRRSRRAASGAEGRTYPEGGPARFLARYGPLLAILLVLAVTTVAFIWVGEDAHQPTSTPDPWWVRYVYLFAGMTFGLWRSDR